MQDGVLELRVVDVYNRPVAKPVTVWLKHQVLTDPREYRNQPPAIRIPGLFRAPQGSYILQVDAEWYQFQGRNVEIPASGDLLTVVTMPVSLKHIAQVAFPDFTAIRTDARRLLDNSEIGGNTGSGIYSAFSALERAGFLNLVAKAERVRLPDRGTVLSLLQNVREQKQDRMFVMAAPGLREGVLENVNDETFHLVSGTLHHPPAGFEAVDSYKTHDAHGNLQLTFSTDGTDWHVDMDIDNAQGFDHLGQVIHNEVTQAPTHPYDIHEILLEYQELDPGYSFVLGDRAAGA